MLVMGSNTWEIDVPNQAIMAQGLKFAEDVKKAGVAELQGAYIAENEKMLWCWWETEDLEGLQKAFDAMNAQSGLKSTLYPIEKFWPK